MLHTSQYTSLCRSSQIGVFENNGRALSPKFHEYRFEMPCTELPDCATDRGTTNKFHFADAFMSDYRFSHFAGHFAGGLNDVDDPLREASLFEQMNQEMV